MLVLQVPPQQQESWTFNALSSFGSKLQSGDLTALVLPPNRERDPKADAFPLLSHYYSSPRDPWAISHGLKLQETNPPHCCIVSYNFIPNMSHWGRENNQSIFDYNRDHKSQLCILQFSSFSTTHILLQTPNTQRFLVPQQSTPHFKHWKNPRDTNTFK